VKYLASFLFIATSLYANADVYEKTAEEYQEYLAHNLNSNNTPKVAVEDENSVNLMYDEALSLGNQGGMYWASQQISTYLGDHEHILNRVDFSPLVITYPQYDILPVVVLEDDGRKLISDESKVMRILGKTYFIDSEPKLVMNVPTWRDYLYVDAEPPKEPHKSYELLIEKYPDIWMKGIKAGWDIGIEQAIYTIQTRISRMTRDYIGYVRYHLIKEANMISSPIVNEVYRPVSGGGNILSIEDTLITIEIAPKLSTDRYNWKALPQLPDTSHLFPDLIQGSFIKGLRRDGVH
jgi:hypothetical protein